MLYKVCLPIFVHVLSSGKNMLHCFIIWRGQCHFARSTGINWLAGLSPSLSFKKNSSNLIGFLFGISIRLLDVNKADSFCGVRNSCTNNGRKNREHRMVWKGEVGADFVLAQTVDSCSQSVKVVSYHVISSDWEGTYKIQSWCN